MFVNFSKCESWHLYNQVDIPYCIVTLTQWIRYTIILIDIFSTAKIKLHVYIYTVLKINYVTMRDSVAPAFNHYCLRRRKYVLPSRQLLRLPTLETEEIISEKCLRLFYYRKLQVLIC